MSIERWKKNKILNDWFCSNSSAERAEFQSKMGIVWEECTPEAKEAARKAWVEITGKEHAEATLERHRNEDYQRAIELQERKEDFITGLVSKIMYVQAELKKREFEAYAKIEEMKSERLQQMFTQLAQYVVGGFKEALDSLPKQFLETGIEFVKELQDRKMLPAPPTEKDIVSLSPPAHCLLKRGPNDVVYTYQKGDCHLYQKCIIAYAAHDRSVLGLQFINSPLLDQGGCPLYCSRTLGAQLLGWIVPAISHEKCRLADGLEHKVG